jgi:hypothetical protein
MNRSALNSLSTEMLDSAVRDSELPCSLRRRIIMSLDLRR